MPTERPIDTALRLSKARGWNQTDFGLEMGASSAAISNWKARGMPTDQLQKAAEVLRVSVDQLLGRVALPEDFADVSAVASTYEEPKARRLHVVGRGVDGQMPAEVWVDPGMPAGATGECAALATDDPQAFLVAVEESSMVPRFGPGEFALVEPGTEPDLEDDVLVRFANGQALIRRLLSRRGGWRFGGYNGTEGAYYKPDDVSWVYYIAHAVPRRRIKAQC